jgi:hypothetical protein
MLGNARQCLTKGRGRKEKLLNDAKVSSESGYGLARRDLLLGAQNDKGQFIRTSFRARI